jgi:hypothetical protein
MNSGTRVAVAAAAFAAAGALATPAAADAMGEGLATGEILIIGITPSGGSDPVTDLLIDGVAEVFIDETSETGAATAETMTDPVFVPETSISNLADASASTLSIPLPGSVATADVLTDAGFSFENTSTTTAFTVDLELTYTLETSVLFDSLADDDAFGTATVAVDTSGAFSFFEECISDTLVDPSPCSLGDTVPFSLTIDPLDSGSVDMFVDATAFAASVAPDAVPGPGVLPLLATGLLGLGLCVSRRRAA